MIKRRVDLWYPICELYFLLRDDIRLTFPAVLHRFSPYFPRDSRLVPYVLSASCLDY